MEFILPKYQLHCDVEVIGFLQRQKGPQTTVI